MLKKVLVPLDGSKRAEAVLEPISGLLAHTQGTLILVHAVTAAERFDVGAKAAAQADRKQAGRYLARLAEHYGEKGPGIQERVLNGEASRVIVAEAARAGADLIAMSSHGRSGIREWAFGSVAERVLRTTKIPVLVFRGPVKGRWRLGRLAVALDGTPEAAAALRPAGELAKVLGSELILLHAGALMPASVRDAAVSLNAAGVKTGTAFASGSDVAAALLTAARAAGADVLALTPTTRTPQDRVFFGRVAERILQTADRPLLIVR
jgi:nucleotide-binding universal stress UspA family protein